MSVADQVAQHPVRHVREALEPGLGRHQVPVEDRRQGVVVAQVEVGDAGDRDVELDRIDAGPEQAALGASLQDVRNGGDEGRMQRANAARALQVAGPVQVLAVEQDRERRVLDVVVPGERDEAADRLRRLDLGQVQVLLLAADLLVGALEDREEQILLLAELVVEHPLVDAGAFGDPVHPRTTEAIAGELVGGGGEDRLARGFRIPADRPVPADGSASAWRGLEHARYYPTGRMRYSRSCIAGRVPLCTNPTGPIRCWRS